MEFIFMPLEKVLTRFRSGRPKRLRYVRYASPSQAG